MSTMLDLLPRIQQLGDREAFRFFDGFRTQQWSYRDLYGRIGAVAEHFESRGLGKGDRVLLWGENRPEWVAAFWGCLVRGIEVVPLDFQSSAGLVQRISQESDARLLLHGRNVDPEAVKLDRLAFDEIRRMPPVHQFRATDISPDDVMDILYTSGTTGEPKGVVHRHRNCYATLRSFQKEIERYVRWFRPLQPLRLLDMLPLSHVFGQAAGLYLPILLNGAVVFTTELHPRAVIETIRRQRVTVLVAVPRLLESLRSSIGRRFDIPDAPFRAGMIGAVQRVWQSRRIHAEFGWKFWAFLVGGAYLDPKLEEFWSRLSFLVIQGYGLTETSPVVSMNHPLRPRRGVLGEIIGDQEVQIAPDGEILVRGENVVSEYFIRGQRQPATDEQGWFHTGDLGHIDDQGQLHYRGRTKDVIVISEGLNVYPDDVESVLNGFKEVRESAVVGRRTDGAEQVHAALILNRLDVDINRIVESANQRLEPHQRIRSWSIWTGEDFPRTPSSSLKVKRSEVARHVLKPREEAEAQPREGLERVISDVTGKDIREINDQSRLTEDIGMSSLERIDLLSSLEDRYQMDLEEEALAEIRTVGELKKWIEQERGEVVPGATRDAETQAAIRRKTRPRWARWMPVRTIRNAIHDFAFLPLFRQYVRLSVQGIENLEAVHPPVIFVANHASHVDTPAILASLPRPWRHLVAPAMLQEYFYPYLLAADGLRIQRLSKAAQYFAAVAGLNAYPLPHSMGRIREALKYTAELLDDGYCPLVYPEGIRSPDGTLQPFQPGAGMMARLLEVPIVPIYLDGTFEILSIHERWPKPGRVRIVIGRPIHPDPAKDHSQIARQLEDAIRTMQEQQRSRPRAA